MDYYKGLKTKQPADWQPRECWECFKKIVAFSTDPGFFSRFEIEERKSDGTKVLKYNTTNLVDKLITYNGGDRNLSDELKTKVKEYDRKFKDLKNKIEQNKQPRKTTTLEENRIKAKQNLESVKKFFEDLDNEIKTCLNEISQWMLKDIQEMNSPQSRVAGFLSGVEGIPKEMIQQIITMLSSLPTPTPQNPVEEQPESGVPESRPRTPLPPQRPPRPSVLEQGRQQQPENREPSPGDEGQVPQIWNLDSPPQSPGELAPILERRRNNPQEDQGDPEEAAAGEAAAEEAAAITPTAVAEAALGNPVTESGPVQQQVLTPTPLLKPAPGQRRIAAGIASPAGADVVDTPPPPPGVSPTRRRRLEPNPEPEQVPASPDPTQQSPGTPVPKDKQQGPGREFEPDVVDG
jgi:hypothetical protein